MPPTSYGISLVEYASKKHHRSHEPSSKRKGGSPAIPSESLRSRPSKPNVDACCDELHLAVDLLQLDTASRMHKVLQELDTMLVDGFDTLDTALRRLPAIALAVSAIEYQTRSVKADTEAIKVSLWTDKEREAMKALLDWFCEAGYIASWSTILAEKSLHCQGFVIRVGLKLWFAGGHVNAQF